MLLRKSAGSNNFDQPLQTGSVVLLGEEIVLRASVQDGDGKLKMQKMVKITFTKHLFISILKSYNLFVFQLQYKYCAINVMI